MVGSHELSGLGSHAFEHMVNSLTQSVLGAGATGFGPGADGGRDGYFEGEAPYPSAEDRWKGVWYIQSKFHAPHLSDDSQKWLLDQVKAELKAFDKEGSKRRWPDNWIVATNIDPSGVPGTGAFDKARELVASARPRLASRFHIWGGAKILDLLSGNRHVAERYGHLLTPGHVLAEIMASLSDDRAGIDSILQQLIARKFKDQKQTKLEQAGSQSDTKPVLHDLFVDLPFRCREHHVEADLMTCFTRAGSEVHLQQSGRPTNPDWRLWARHPRRARVWFVRGGPGQGKSTVGQYYCQIQRAALILDDAERNANILKVSSTEFEAADQVAAAAKRDGYWPSLPRIPLHVELKEYAQWVGGRKKGRAGVLSFLAEELGNSVEQTVQVGTILHAMKGRRWVAVFDGLDEVPEDVKDRVAAEVTKFINQIALEHSCDLFSLCTSRPQGYSGQFKDLDAVTADLLPLPTERALACARPVIRFQKPEEESRRAIALLESSVKSPAIRELMTTPLQSHILAVVVRDGEKPPDRRWKLYARFYDVIRRRESNRDLPDLQLAHLIGSEEKLLKAIHNRVGFYLHAAAETSQGAETSLDKETFRALAHKTVSQMVEDNIDQKVDTLDKATRERLVLINTPEHGTKLRFDIRQLQEFFAGECLYDSVKADELKNRIATVAGDAHWREVTHFLLSSLVENDRNTELSVAIDQLRRLNEGDSDEFGGLCRRAGKGALLVARLLSEGVLEQDRAIRQSFRECLTPMTGFASIGRLVALLNVKQENSRSWLITFLIEKLRDSAPAENIGAAIVLAHILPDTHPRLADIQQHLLRSSASYIGVIVDSFARRVRDDGGVESPRWFVDLLLQLLSGPNWADLGGATISRIGWLLRQVEELKGMVGESSSGLSKLLPFLHLVWHERPSEQEKVIGNLRLSSSRPEMDADQAFAKASPHAFSREALGVFRVIQAVLQFHSSPNRSDYAIALRGVHAAGNELLWPLRVVLQFPMPRSTLTSSLSEMADAVDRMIDEEFTAYLSSDAIDQTYGRDTSYWEFGIEDGRPVAAAELIECYGLSRQLAFEIVAFLSQHRREDLYSTEAVDQFTAHIVPELRVDPSPLIDAPWCWQALIGQGLRHDAELRDLITAGCRVSLPYRRPAFTSLLYREVVDAQAMARTCALFAQSEEPAVLPHISDYIIVHMRMYGVGRQKSPHPLLSTQLVSELANGKERLTQLSGDVRQCWSVRCSAALMRVLVAGENATGQELDPAAGDFLAHCNSSDGEWLLEGLVTVLTTVLRKPSPSVSILVRDLFESCREDYDARISLEQILSVWQELSSAPVTTQNLRDRWMFHRSDG